MQLLTLKAVRAVSGALGNTASAAAVSGISMSMVAVAQFCISLYERAQRYKNTFPGSAGGSDLAPHHPSQTPAHARRHAEHAVWLWRVTMLVFL